MKGEKTKDIINIKDTSVIGHIGSRKHINDDWGTLAFLIPRDEVRSTFVEQELRFNSIYMLISLGGGTERVYESSERYF